MWPFRANISDESTSSSSTTAASAETSTGPPTARQARSTRRDGVRSTSEDHLQAVGPRGISITRDPSPQARIRNIANRNHNSSRMDAEQLQAIITAAVTAAAAGQTENNRAIVEAAVNAAAANHVSSQQSMRRPALPPFDPKDIVNWIRRVEAAFDRLSITSPRVKLSNLDEKLSTSGDATVNEFLCKAPTQESYDGLIDYLKQKHGRTKSQKASSLIEGTEREGRTPSQLLATMKELADDITLDDIFKEQLLRRLPSDVRMHLVKSEDKSAVDIAKEADSFFEKDGKPKLKPSVSINAVRTPRQQQTSSTKQTQPPRSASPEATTFFSTPFEDDNDTDVHAVRFKQGQRQHINVNNSGGGRPQSQGVNNGRSQSRGRFGNSSGFGRRSTASSSSSTTQQDPKLCYYHNKFGKEARTCTEDCKMYTNFKAGNAKASK